MMKNEKMCEVFEAAVIQLATSASIIRSAEAFSLKSKPRWSYYRALKRLKLKSISVRLFSIQYQLRLHQKTFLPEGPQFSDEW